MATTFYLTAKEAGLPMPIDKQSADTILFDCATTYATYSKPALLSTTPASANITNSCGTEDDVVHYTHYGTWISPPLNAQTISGTITVGLCMYEQDALMDNYPRIKVYKWLANNTLGSDLLALETSATECTAAYPASPTVYFNAVAITSTTFESGDKIVIEIESEDNNLDPHTNWVHGIKFAGAAGGAYGSYITFSDSVTFSSTQLLIGGTPYGFKLNSLNIDTRIGERGTASFQIQEGISSSVTGSGGFLNGGSYINSDGLAPANGTRISFTGPVPYEVGLDSLYWVVDSSPEWHYFRISDTYGGPAGSWSIPDYLATTWVEYQPYIFSIGESIDVYIDGDRIWSGVTERINKQLPQGSTSILYSFRGIDWTYALDKRRVVATYSTDVTAGLSAQYIVDDIVHSYLYIEGITTGQISTGANLGNVAFNYIQPSKCLDMLAEQSGYIWQINPDKSLDFKPHDYETISFNIGSTQIIYDQLQYIESNPKYRNTQYVVGGIRLTEPLTEVQFGDSTKQAYVMPYMLMNVPAISAFIPAETTQTVGIQGVDTTQHWFWNKYSKNISQNSTDTPLTAVQKLWVDYIGGYKDITASVNTTAISDRREHEGGSGMVEDVFNGGVNSYYSDNQILGDKLITKYSTMTNTLTFRTRTPGISPGKILKVSFPEFNLSSEEMLVDSVSIKDQEGGMIWYNVSALTGPEHGGWSKYFDDFFTRAVEKDIWSQALGDIVIVSTSRSEGFTWTELTTESVFACPLCSSSNETEAGAGTGLYPTSSNEVVNPVLSTHSHYPC